MQNRYTLLVFLSLVILFSGNAVQAQGPQLIYYAMPAGSEVVPAVATNGKGLVTLLFNNDQSKVNISGMLLTLDGDITAATLVSGKKGENGTVLVDILPFIIGRRVAGDLDVPAGLIKDLVFNNLYVLVSTTLHPEGEIRGQFIAETDLNFRIEMGGDQVVPPVVSTGYSFGGIHYALGSDEIDYAFLVSGLSGPVTETAFYDGDPGQNGTAFLNLPGTSGNLVFGVLDLNENAMAFVEKCENEKVYVVLKTAAFPDGEVRGQIRFLGNLNSFAPVNGFQAIPSAPSPGFGLNYTTPNATLDSLTTTVFVAGITPVTARLHTGLPGTVGPVFAEMEPTGFQGLYQKTYPLTPAVMSDFANGRMYLNFGTVNLPDGEIRGALRTNLRRGYAFDLCGSQVVPPTSSTGLGMAMASVDLLDCYLDYKIIVDGLLSGATVDAAIRSGAEGQTGAQLYSMPTTDPFIADFHAIAAGEGALIEQEGTYMELYTPAFPNGEIRGQIRRELTCPLLAFNTGEQPVFSGLAIYPVPFNDLLHIQLESAVSAKGRLVLYDMFGKITAAQEVQFTEGSQFFDISTRELPAGVYRIMVEGEGRQVSRIVIKQDN